MFDLRSLWDEIEALDGRVAAQTQLAMLLKARILLERATRWLLRNRPRPLDIAAASAHFGPGAAALAAAAGDVLSAADREVAHRTARGARRRGRSSRARRARRAARVPPRRPSTSSRWRRRQVVGLEEAAGVYFAIDDRLELHALRDAHRRAAPRGALGGTRPARAVGGPPGRAPCAHRRRAALESESGPAAERLATWIAHNAAAVERCVQVLADVKAGAAADLATLSVAVREIRNLIDATSAPTREARKPVEQPVTPVSRPSG